VQGEPPEDGSPDSTRGSMKKRNKSEYRLGCFKKGNNGKRRTSKGTPRSWGKKSRRELTTTAPRDLPR